MGLNCTCDICGHVMGLPSTLNDPDRLPDVLINTVYGFSGCRLDYVCEDCRKILLTTIDSRKNRSYELNDEFRSRAYAIYKDGKRFIEAIKNVRSWTGLGLKETKDLCEKWRDEWHWDSSINPNSK